MFLLAVVGILEVPRLRLELKKFGKTRMVKLRPTKMLNRCHQQDLGPTKRRLWQLFCERISHRLIAETPSPMRDTVVVEPGAMPGASHIDRRRPKTRCIARQGVEARRTYNAPGSRDWAAPARRRRCAKSARRTWSRPLGVPRQRRRCPFSPAPPSMPTGTHRRARSRTTAGSARARPPGQDRHRPPIRLAILAIWSPPNAPLPERRSRGRLSSAWGHGQTPHW